MGGSPYKIFSVDYNEGVVSPSYASLPPDRSYVIDMNEETAKLREKLFVMIRNASFTSHSNDHQELLDPIDVSSLPSIEELKDFFTIGSDQKLHMKDLEDGLVEIGINFIAKSADIQERGNSYILQMIGSAELKVLKENSNEDIAELYERAQLVLLLTPPLSSSDTSSESDVTALPRSTQAVEAASRWGPRMHEQEFSPVDPSPSAVSSFYRIRANSEDVIVIRKEIPFFRATKGTSMAIKTFLPEFFNKEDSINMADCSSEVYTKMREFWDFFDTDLDGIVSRNDVEKGFAIMAANFISKDEVSQKIVNAFLQRRLQYIITALKKLEIATARHRANKEAAVTDSSTNDEYSVHGYIKGRRRKTLKFEFQPGDLARFWDAEGVDRTVRIKEKLSNGTYRLFIGVGSATIDIVGDRLYPVTQTQRTDSTPSTTDSDTSSRSIGSSTSPTSFDSTGSTQNDVYTCPSKNPDPKSPGRGSSEIKETSWDLCEGSGPVVRTGAGAGAEESVTGQEDLLSALRETLGPGYGLVPYILPAPNYRESYHLKFGSERRFWFEKQDFGIHYEPFLGLEYVSDPALVIACPSAMESFRCMFIHLGVGVKVHPFALQVKFRAAAERLLSSNEGEAKSLFTEHLLSVIMSDSYCEMDVLNTVWPSELDGYRIMLVTFQEVDAGSKGFYGFKSIVTYTPESGPFDSKRKWIGQDVIMTLKDGHFTLLVPDPHETKNSFPWGPYPITDLVLSIEEYNKEFESSRICLQQLPIGKYLQRADEASETPSLTPAPTPAPATTPAAPYLPRAIPS